MATSAVALAVLATIALLGVALFSAANLVGAWRAYVPAMTGLAVWLLVRVIAARNATAGDAAFLAALRPAMRQSLQPGAIGHLGRVITFAEQSAVDLHFRLRPLLREIATQRLAVRRNIALDGQPAAAASALGPAAWALLRPDRPLPANGQARGIDAAALAAILSALEEI